MRRSNLKSKAVIGDLSFAVSKNLRRGRLGQFKLRVDTRTQAGNVRHARGRYTRTKVAIIKREFPRLEVALSRRR